VSSFAGTAVFMNLH